MGSTQGHPHVWQVVADRARGCRPQCALTATCASYWELSENARNTPRGFRHMVLWEADA